MLLSRPRACRRIDVTAVGRNPVVGLSIVGPGRRRAPGSGTIAGRSRDSTRKPPLSVDALLGLETLPGRSPGWRNWQTRKLEVLVSNCGRAGSNPVPGIHQTYLPVQRLPFRPRDTLRHAPPSLVPARPLMKAPFAPSPGVAYGRARRNAWGCARQAWRSRFRDDG